MLDADPITAKHFSLSIITMSFFAFEGYMNWLGELLLPEVWQSEREFFRRKPYFGTLGKCKLIARTLHIEDFDESTHPLNAVVGLQSVRDQIVHPKSERGERNVEHDYPEPPPNYTGRLADLVTPALARQAMIDLESIANRIHSECRRHFPNHFPSSKPFSGLIGYETTDT